MTDASLDDLNDAERRVLRLLAEGHTIKSAAGVIGSTQAALNERLREARRKTGMGSSRELARELKAQENRDDLIEVEEENYKPSSVAPADAFSRRRRIGVTIMTIAAIAVAGALALTSQPTTEALDDPLIDRPLPSGVSPKEFHARVRAENRDAAWAGRAETILRYRYEAIPYVGEADNELHIRCSTTICEVAGTLPRVSGDNDRADVKEYPVNATVRELQAHTLFEELQEEGLAFETFVLASTTAQPKRPVFFSYFTRNKH